MGYSIVDTSILSEFRGNNGYSLSTDQVRFFDQILEKFDVKISESLITEKLFIEMIGHGKIRKNIKKKHSDHIKSERIRLVKSFSLEREERSSLIIHHILFLKDLFFDEFRRHFPRGEIVKIALRNFDEYKFVNKFKTFRSKLIRFAWYLDFCIDNYDYFINVLVEDSVIRYALNAINIREISPKYHDVAFEIINQLVSGLMYFYYNSDALNSNLNLFGSALKKHIEERDNPQGASRVLLRMLNDFADVELGYYPLYGKLINGNLEEITVITNESEFTVTERLKYNFQAIGTKASIIEPQKIRPGRTLLINLNDRSYKEISSRDFIQKNFRSVSGEPIF